MTLGIIARADNSGLGTQTWEMARHTKPSKVLVVHQVANHRGPAYMDRYTGQGAQVTTALLAQGERLSNTVLRSWLQGLTCVYTAESDYGCDLAYWCAHEDVKLVVHANPELWSERYRDASTKVFTPTSWEVERIPAAHTVPMPVNRQRLPWRRRGPATTFWHPAAPAFHDRHGSELVRKALAHIQRPSVRIVVTGATDRDRWFTANTGMAQLVMHPSRANYWDLYDSVDVLLLPRRYGGLSLPVQEALSAGVPVIMLDTGPYAGRGGVLTIPTLGYDTVHMKGGYFDVHTTDAELIAREIEELTFAPKTVANASNAADVTAHALDWAEWESTWMDHLHP